MSSIFARIILVAMLIPLTASKSAASCIDQKEAFNSPDTHVLPLVNILSEPENMRLHTINLHLDESGDILGLTRVSGNTRQVICPEQLFEGEVLLAKSGGIDAVFLGCEDCSVDQGGVVNLRYIFNGALRTYHNLKMNLARRDGRWSLETREGQEIKKLKLISRYILGKVIGISTVAIN